MRVIPVIDLKGGRAVHAVRGERGLYEPLRSVLVDSADPITVGSVLRARLGLDDLYIADLDAIELARAPDPSITSLARAARVMLDAGTGDVDAVRSLMGLAVDGVVIGTETLGDADALFRIRASLGHLRIVLSVDLRAGRVVSRAGELAGLEPGDALELLIGSGVDEVIVLDLARVGTGAGPDIALIAELHARFPGLQLLAGGGVRNARDLSALRAEGAAGALLGTALHSGAIGRDELAALRGRG